MGISNRYLLDIATGSLADTISPQSNVLITRDVRAVMCDFGVAQVTEDTGFRALETATANRSKSYRWCSPERFSRQPPSSPSDIWALGWLIWEASLKRIKLRCTANHALRS